ncbi:dihydroneopterin aldolase [Nocardioides caldifontis]|uniref:dihydroneopterin aldolase n=1 Tax=Nocardioides caldifontis TaxID=2588938 RepID=UPI00193999D1|nr:dihydroneopterin aldolase [Nocardioides caldifontis]
MTETTPDPTAAATPVGAQRLLDRLSITGIEAFGHHGVFDFERRDGQPFVVDLVLGVDTRAAAASDDLEDTVDYGALTTRVKEAVEGDPVDLVETVAQRVADVCLADDRVGWAEVTLHKPQAPIDATFTDVALTIHRSRG